MMSLQCQRMLQVLLLLLMMVAPSQSMPMMVAPSQSMCGPDKEAWCNPHNLIQYRLTLPSYPDFIGRMRYYLVKYTKHLDVRGRSILAKQTDGKPPGWKMTQLLGLGNFNTTLAIRADNLYIVGFANRTGHWHVFPKYRELIPEATVLDFNEDYGSLIGGHWNLQYLKLGEKATLDSVEILSEYNKLRNRGNNIAARRAIATLAVTVCEASRFTTIYNVILRGWSSEIYLNAWQAHFVVNWRIMSCALLIWSETGQWGTDGSENDETIILRNRLGIEHPHRVLSIIKLLIWPKPWRCHKPVLKEKRTIY